MSDSPFAPHSSTFLNSLSSPSSEAAQLPVRTPAPALSLSARRLRSERRRRGMTQEDVAKLLDLKDRQSISNIEKGKRPLSLEEVMRLSKALDLDSNFFLSPFGFVEGFILAWSTSAEMSILPPQDNNALLDFVSLHVWLTQETHAGQDPKPFIFKCLRLGAHPSATEIETAADRVRGLWGFDGSLQNVQDIIRSELGVGVLWVDCMIPEGFSAALVRMPEEDLLVLDQNALPATLQQSLGEVLFLLLNAQTFSMVSLQQQSAARNFSSELMRDLACGDLPMEAFSSHGLGDLRNAFMLHEALTRGLISFKKAARLLGLTPEELVNSLKHHYLDIAFAI